MIGDILSKLQEARIKIEETKKNLDHIVVEATSADGNIRVKASANKSITGIHISENLFHKSKEEIEEQLMATINQALNESANLGEQAMKEVTRDILPNFPGLI